MAQTSCEHLRAFGKYRLCGLTLLNSPELSIRCPVDGVLPAAGCPAKDYVDGLIEQLREKYGEGDKVPESERISLSDHQATLYERISQLTQSV